METMTPRFFYLVPGFTKRRFGHETRWQGLKRLLFWGGRQVPAGGVKIIYQHCDLLNKNGIEAFPVHLGDFKIDWFAHESSAMTEREALDTMEEADVLICPEVLPSAADPYPSKKKIVFVQSWALADAILDQDKHYEDFGFSGLLVCSHFIEDHMRTRSDLPSWTVINGIDLEVFKPLPQRQRPRQVLYLNRKNVEDARRALGLLDADIRKTANFNELESRYTQDQMVRFYQETDIFMATGYPEGFGLPPLEAMACGCAVIGFTGGGGKEHMKEGETALIAPDGDVAALALLLKRILTDETLKEKIRKGGLKMAQTFSIERMEKELLELASALRDGPKDN